MEYASAIVNEIGHVVKWCSDLDGEEIDEILTQYPEYTVVCIEVGGCY